MAVDERLPQLCKPSLLVVHTVQCNLSIQRTVHTPRCLWACMGVHVHAGVVGCACMRARVCESGWVSEWMGEWVSE